MTQVHQTHTDDVEPLRVALVGLGSVGKAVCRLVVRRGGRVVGAYNRPGSKVGQDVGAVSGLDVELGVSVSDDLGRMLSAGQPDIAVIGVGNYLDEMMPMYEACLAAGVNVICAGTETSYAWPSSPTLARRLDDYARQHGVTITGGGNQDFLIIRSGTHLAAVCDRIDTIVHRRLTDVDAHGVIVADQVNVNRTVEDAEAGTHVSEGGRISVYQTFARQIVADLGWDAVEVREVTTPVVARMDLASAALGCIVEAGRVTGSREVCEISTSADVLVRIEAEMRLLETGETERVDWEIEGVPAMRMSIRGGSSHETTVTQIVNRLADVVAAEPGYVTLEQLPALRYHARLGRPRSASAAGAGG